jgi:HK97 gp10 family phage protein
MPFEITGINEMLAKLKKVNVNVEKVKEKALKAGAEPIRKAMSKLVRRGVKENIEWLKRNKGKYALEHLQDNIIISEVKDDSVFVGPDKHFYYASMLEFGTVNMDSYPFAEPGYLEGRKEALENIAEVVREAIEDNV